MMNRAFDIILSTVSIVILAPLFIVITLLIILIEGRPVLFIDKRIGLNNKTFRIFKFRTMRMHANGNKITSTNDARIFKLGAFLRKSKIDELPQLFNILIGDMTIIGPRPEDESIVQSFYTGVYLETLNVKPGLASPGSIFNYTHGRYYLGNNISDKNYIDTYLPIKLSLDVYYVRNKNIFYDIRLMMRTIYCICKTILGFKSFKRPPEYNHIKDIIDAKDI